MKCNIAFVTLGEIGTLNSSGLYVDLINSLISLGNRVTVITPSERRKRQSTVLIQEKENAKILKVKIGNITKTNSIVEKGISTLLVEFQYLKAIKKYLGDENFDLVLYSTPPITFSKVIKYFKKKYKSKSYLLLKDIFPQNAIDIGMMKENSLIHNLFRKKEVELYKLSDKIGTMSSANRNYILEKNSYLDSTIVEVFPNSIIPKKDDINQLNRERILKEFDVASNKTIFTYGGNIGRPQGISFLIEVIRNFHKVGNGHLVIVGDGTEYGKIESELNKDKYSNITLINKLPKDKYDEFLSATDVGLIFLDNRFTIPNFPSRLLSYLESSIPIIAATDPNTDIGKVIENAKCGLWVESNDIDAFIKKANKIAKDRSLREQMGTNARDLLLKDYDVRRHIYKIIRILEEDK